MLHHLGDRADPSCDCTGLSKDPFLRPGSTRKHASWLDIVEIEIGVLRECLDRRIDSKERLVSEMAAWERQRRASRARIKWMFTTEKGRDKTGRAYPKLSTKESKSL
jgi:hypothetical protein